MRGLFEVVKGKTGKQLGGSELYHQWRASGGAHAALVSIDRNYLQASVRDITRTGAKDKVIDLVTHPIDALRALSETTEEATRMGEFVAARKGKGKFTLDELIDATLDSRDVTLDFSRAGTLGKQVNRVTAFWNAQVQGMDKMVREFAKHPGKTTAKATAYITTPTVLLYMLNRNNPRYQERPEWEKDMFWFIPTTKDGPLVRIPRPFELGLIFGALPERMLRWIDSKDPHAFDGFARDMKDSMLPGVLPTALVPLIQIWANRSFSGSPIIPRREQDQPKELQFGAETSSAAIELGRRMKQSPRIIDYIIRGYTGGLGKYGMEAAGTALEATGLSNKAPGVAKTALEKTPGIKGLIANEFTSSVYINRLYDERDKLQEQEALAEAGRGKRLTTEQEGRLKALDDTARTLADLRKTEREVQAAADDEALDKALAGTGITTKATDISGRKREALLALKDEAGRVAKDPKRKIRGGFKLDSGFGKSSFGGSSDDLSKGGF
jgi:hypothetical protein